MHRSPMQSLLYTGLRKAPTTLCWPDAPQASAYDLYVNGRKMPPLVRPVFAWPQDFPLRAEELVQWMFVPCDGPKASLLGQFWVLSKVNLARLAEAEEVAKRIEDPEMREIARAFITANFGLYDEAMARLDRLATCPRRRGREALLQRAYVAVLTEMQDRLRPEANETVRSRIAAHLARHRKRLLACLPAACTVT